MACNECKHLQIAVEDSPYIQHATCEQEAKGLRQMHTSSYEPLLETIHLYSDPN